MAKVHDRILEVTLVTAQAAGTLAVSSVKYYRDRSQIDASNGLAISFTPTTAQTTPAEITFGELVPPPTHLRFSFTANV